MAIITLFLVNGSIFVVVEVTKNLCIFVSGIYSFPEWMEKRTQLDKYRIISNLRKLTPIMPLFLYYYSHYASGFTVI